jgi:hypothetical protein
VSDEKRPSRICDSDGTEDSQGQNYLVAILDQFLGGLTPTGDSDSEGQMLNAQVFMKITTSAVFAGGLRESLIALLRSPHHIEHGIREALADALERGASGETPEESGLSSWKLQIVGLGSGKGTQNNQGEQVRARQRWGVVGQFMQSQIASKGAVHGAREKAISAAMKQFNVSRESAEKSLRYVQRRELWVKNMEQILSVDYADDSHRDMAFGMYRLEYDTLHARHKDAPANRLAEASKFKSL